MLTKVTPMINQNAVHLTTDKKTVTVTLPTNTELLKGGLVSIDSSHKLITTNSLKVAEHFGKRPSNVNQKIRRLMKNGRLKIKPSYYRNQQDKQQIYYPLTRDQFLQVVFGFTGDKAEQFHADFIKLFNQQEAELNEWRKSRQSIIEPTKIANDSIEWLKKELTKEIPESRKPNFLYTNIQCAIKKVATGHAHTKRSEMTTEQLKIIEWLEVQVHQEIERLKTLGLSALEIREQVLTLIKGT